MQKVMFISNDSQEANYIKKVVHKSGYEFLLIQDGYKVRSQVDNLLPDVIILSTSQQDLSPLVLANDIRELGHNTPVVLYSKALNATELNLYLDGGVTDFIFSPVRTNEVSNRILINLNRKDVGTEELTLGDLKLDLKNFKVTKNNKNIRLSPKEFYLLKLLMSNKGRVLTRTFILNTIWAEKPGVNKKIVDVYMKRLREKLDSKNPQRYISTLRGFGYKIRE